MKKITLLFFMLICSMAGYSQLALEGFEGTWPPADWSIYNIAGPAQTWIQGDVANGQPAHEGTKTAYINRENVATGLTEDFLVTKPFNVPANPQLRFWSRLTIAGYTGSIYRVMLLQDGEDASDPANYELLAEWTEAEINPSNEEWNQITLSHPSFAGLTGTNARIAFVMLGDFHDRWIIDEVEVVSECLMPTDLTANNITQTSADLSWANPSGATSWEIEIMENTAAPTGVGISISDMPYSVTGLAPDTCYKYYVKSECTASNESEWEGPFTFCTVAPGATCNAPWVVTALPFATSNNTGNFGDDYSGSPGSSGCGTTGSYLNGDDVVYAYTAAADGVISIDATGLGDWAGMFVYDNCADVGVECIAGGTGSTTTPISIPSLSVTAGTTYYVVISTWASPQTTPYNLVIQQVNCAPPVGLPTTNIGQTSADLSWTNPSGATSWELVIQAPGSGIPPGAGTTVTTNTNYPATGLTQATPYEYWVRADCGNGTFSAWAGPYLFNTTICEAIDQCTYSLVLTDSFGDGWNGNTMTLSQNGIALATVGSTFTTGTGPVEITVPVCDGLPIELYWNSGGNWAAEVGIAIENNYGQQIYVKAPGSGTQNTLLYTGTVDCDNPLCLPPTGLYAANTTTTSAEIGWDGPATGTWEYYVVTEGGPAPTDADAIATGTNPTLVTGLTQSTEYEFYVRMVCTGAATPTSDWAGPFNFATQVCEAAAQCNYTFNMTSDWWIGYDDATMVISQNGTTVAVIGPTFTTGQTQSVTVPLCTNIPFEVFWQDAGGTSFQIGLSIVNNFDQTLYTMTPGSATPGTLLFSSNMDCLVPACLAPEDLTVDNETTTTADLSWAGPATGSWEYYVVPAGDPAPGDATPGTATTTNPVTATGLTAATNYEYYVRVICDATTNSPWAGPFAFNTTVCEPADQCNYIFEMTDSWGDGWNGNTMTIFQGGVAVATIGSTFTTGTGPVTVEVPMCPGVPFEVFWNFGGSFANEVGVTMYTPFAEDVFTKAPGTGSQGTVLYSGSAAMASCTPPPCPKPQDLVVNDILTNSVELEWTEMGTAISWEVEVVTFGTAPTGAGTVVTTNPVLWDDLTSGTTYQYYVRAICGGDDGNSNWSGPFTFTTAIENDDCAGAIPAPVNPGGECIDFATGTLTGATGSAQTQTCVTWTTIQWDVWYSFTAEATTHAVAVTEQVGAFYQTVIYEGDGCGTLTQIACGDDNQVITGLTVGETYYVQVYTTWLPDPNAPTSFHICVQTPEPPIAVNDTQYTIEELVTDVLIDADCALVSNITSLSAIDFGSGSSIGYFHQNGSSFPFEDGVVMASGNISEAQGPWPGMGGIEPFPWPGDADLQAINTANGQPNQMHNATVLEFDFVPTIPELSFNFIFASAEYGTFQCFFSDAFAFILTDVTAGTPAQNLAVIPGTDIPVSVTTIRDSQYNTSCDSQNVEYFDQYNPANPNASSIGYAGQTVPMQATATVTPGNLYHIKLVIADYSDTALASAVFIDGGSFNFGEIDLGESMLENQGTAACNGELVPLVSGLDPDLYDFVWYQDGEVIPGATGPDYTVTEAGVYGLIANYQGTECDVTGEVTIEYFAPIEVVTNDPLDLNFCDASGFAEFNLEENTANIIPPLMEGLIITYHLTQADAEANVNPIASPYTNVVQYQQTIYVRIATVSGCTGFKTFNLNVDDLTPEFDIPAALALCEGGTGTISVVAGNFDVNGPNVSFTWTHDGDPLADEGSSISVTEAGVYEVIVNNTGCTATASTTVTVSPTPDASISYDGSPYCSDGTTAAVTHSGNTGGVYSASEGLVIDPATGTINLATSTPGTYEVIYTLEATATCDEFVTPPTTVVITPAPNAEFTYDSAAFCMNAGIATPTFDGGATAGAFTVDVAGLAIDPATGVINPATSTEGTYIVTNTIAAGGGCEGVTSSVTVQIIAAPVGTFNYAQAAYCQEDAALTASPILDGVAGTFSATPAGLSINPSTGVIDLAASQPGTYVVENLIAATAECPEVPSETTVVINATPVFTLGGPYVVCDAQFATITVDAENFDTATATYVWTLDGNPLADTGSSITASGFGTYEVVVTTAAGCTDSQSVNVTENAENVEFDFVDGCEDNVYSLEVVAVNGSFDPETATFTWTGPEEFGDPQTGVGLSSIVPNVTGNYTVTFVTPEGCTGTNPYTVESTTCFVQRGISPGDDDKNNTFDLTALDVTRLSIFNRYGQEVFSYGNYTNQWGGQDNSGNELPTGTYFYSFERANGETKTGWIYVNRQN